MTTQWVGYDSTGEIRSYGACEDRDFATVVQPNLTIMQGVGTNATAYVANGAIVPYTTAQAATKAAAPSYPATWSNATFTWTDARTLAQAQATQIALLGASYTAAIAMPVSYTSQGGVTKTYDADTASVSNVANMQLAFAAAGTVPAGFYWVSADNTQVPFTYADIQGLAAAMGAQGFAAFATLQSKKGLVLAATTNAAVAAITWTSNP